MSGHSKWSTIKHQKAVNDKARGQVFSKLVKAITVAVKTGGGPDPDSNYKLRMAIDAAKAANMPKNNVDRAISNASKSTENLEEVSYEGFGPEGVGILVETATNNKNRTSQEIKNILERGGGSMGGPGSVSFNFEPMGMLLINKQNLSQDQILSLIDYGIQDFDEDDNYIEAYVSPHDLQDIKSKLSQNNYNVEKIEYIKHPKLSHPISEKNSNHLINILNSLEEHDDVQKVFTNAEIPD